VLFRSNTYIKSNSHCMFEQELRRMLFVFDIIVLVSGQTLFSTPSPFINSHSHTQKAEITKTFAT
jgi:hypothetical protein